MEQIGSLWVYSALLFAVLTANYSSAQKQDYKRVCYYTNWSQYRTGLGKFKPQNVDPFVCTHIVYAFAKTSGNRIEAAEWNDESTEWSKGMYGKINDLKKKNPKLKTLLAIGGWTEGNAPISTMASTNESRDEFVSTTIQYLRTRGFDGLDLDWEYPGSRGGPPEDKENLIHLLKKLRTEFNREARETGREALLLAIAVPVGEERISSGYKIPEVDRYVDFINLMAYDFHGAWEAQTGHHSPLHRGKAERWYAAQLNVQWAAGYWRRNGASKEKLLIGIAMYGRGFKLQYPSINGIGAQALVGSNGNSMGPFTKSKGLLSFYEICDRLNGNGVEVWDEERRVPYMYDGSDWVGYENVRSVIEKTKWVMDHGYAGIMIWALDQDDFTGHFCKAGKYPLLSAINKTLNEHTPSTEILTGQRDILQATEDYGGITNRIVDSTSLSLTGLTLRHSQTPNAIIHTTTIATTSTTAASIKTTTNVATSTIISSTTSTTEPSTTTTEPSSTTTSEPPTTTTTTEPPTTTVEPSTTTGLTKATSFTELTTAAEDKENSTAPSTGNISTTDTMESESQNDSLTNEKISPAIATLDIVSDNITSDLHLMQNVSSDIENITVDFLSKNESDITNHTTISSIALTENSTESPIKKESTTARIMRSRSQIMSIVAPSDIYSSTDIVHRGRTLLQVDLNRNEQPSNNGDGQTSGFTSVLNSLFSVLSEFGGFARGSRSSSNRRANSADTAGQGTVESQRPRNAEPQRSRNVDPTRQRNTGMQRQRNADTQPARNREVPVRRNDADFQRVRNGLRASNGEILRQNNVDQSRLRMLPRTRGADSARPVQSNGDPTLRRNGETFRQRNAESPRQQNEILRRNNDLMRQRNGNNDILRQRSENPEPFRQRNVNGDIVRQRNGDLSQQQRNTFRNGDLIQQRNAANLNSRDAEPRRQRTLDTTRRMQQRTPSLTPNRRSQQLGGMNTVSPQFDPFQNVEMATIPQNLGPRSTRRGESNSIPSVDFLETLVQGSSSRNIDPTVINRRGIETNRIPTRNPNQISQGVPDISTLTDMFFAQDPQNQLLQQEAVQTSISEAMLSPNFVNRANGFGRLQRMITPEPVQSSNIFDNRNISSNRQASQMRETLFNEIINRQPSLNTNSIDTIDLAFLESQVEEGFARDRAQQIEQSMLRPGMLVNEPRQGILNRVLPAAAGFQGLIGQVPSQQGSIGRNSMIPRPNQFQQASMQLPQTNRNTSMAVIPFNNLDRTLQRIVASGPGFRLRNQTTSTRSVLQNPTEQGFFLQNGQRTPRAGNLLNPTLVRPGSSQENNRNILTSQPGLPGPLQLARLQDSLRPNRNMLGPLGPIQGNRNAQPMNNFLTSSLRGSPRIGTPLSQTANTNNQLPLNSLFSPMNQISPRVSTIGSPGTPHITPPPFASTAIQTPDEVIQGRNVIGSKSVFSQRTNSSVNIDGSMLKSEPVIPKSEILWKWDV